MQGRQSGQEVGGLWVGWTGGRWVVGWGLGRRFLFRVLRSKDVDEVSGSSFQVNV